MRLPSLTLIIASQAIIWCAAGAAIHGPMILLYPLSWLMIGTAFWLHVRNNPIKAPAAPAEKQQWANSASNNTVKASNVEAITQPGDVVPPSNMATTD